MKVQEIRKIARKLAIPAGKLKKVDLIRTIQRTEGNAQCFGSGWSGQCGQDECLWADDCK